MEIESPRSPEWFSMALSALRAAKTKTSIPEFRRLCSMQIPKAGMSVNDRLRVADELIELGKIRLIDDRLSLPAKFDTAWLEQSLLAGSEVAWEIASEIGDNATEETNLFDADQLKKIGDLGELRVLEELKDSLETHLHHRISHVSRRDDSAGFDISSPSIKDVDRQLKLEVKTTCRPGNNFRFFLSRNEFEVGIRDKNWRLVFVQLSNNVAILLGHLPVSVIAARFPIDQEDDIRWQNVRVDFARDLIKPGLP
jgi:hypothetical protein